MRASVRTYRTSGLTLLVVPSLAAQRTRVGLVVPKHRNRVVDRNQLKRRLRELVRMEVFPVGVDALIRCDPSAYAMSFEELRKRVRELYARAKLR